LFLKYSNSISKVYYQFVARNSGELSTASKVTIAFELLYIIFIFNKQGIMWPLIISAGLLLSASVANMETDAENKGNPSSDQWEVVRNNNGVVTYVRWLHKNDGTKTRERKGDMQVDCSLKKTVEILTDPAETKKWMSGVSENYLLSKSSPSEWNTYTLYRIPWPFNNRDLVSVFSIKNNPGNKIVIINVTSKADCIPPKPGIERLKDYRATWTITETAPQTVRIIFSAMSDTPPMFPRYIQDPIIEKMFHNNLVRLKVLLSQ
jgi:hypothetical protein